MNRVKTQMQSDQQRLPDQVGRGYVTNPPFSSFFGQNVGFGQTVDFGQNVDFQFQPSKICPRNFVIFDRSYNHSQIMYHPETAPCLGYIQENPLVRNDENGPREERSFMKEDSADIDLLLSFEEDEDEECEEEEEEVSTARTHGNDENALTSDTADSCSLRRGNGRLGISLSSSSCKSSGSERKREKMKKMVNSLRGIVPGGNRMNTVGVLDEAVKYLKSLKVELQKGGIGNLKN